MVTSLVVAALALSAGGAKLHLERQGEVLYLVEGSSRLPIVGEPGLETRVGRSVYRYGDRMPASVLEGGRTRNLDLQSAFTNWIAGDEKMEHKAANQLRYLNGRMPGGGVSAYLTQVSPFAGRTLGCVTLRLNTGATQEVMGHILVQLAGAKISFVRFYGDGVDGPLLIFAAPSGRLVLSKNRFVTLDRDGLERKPVANAPGGVAVGLANRRYVVFENANYFLVGFDLQTLKPFPITPASERTTRDPFYLQGIPKEGDYLLMSQGGGPEVRHFTVHIPDGKRIQLSSPVRETWRNYAVEVSGGSATVYSAATGALIISLPLWKNSQG